MLEVLQFRWVNLRLSSDNITRWDICQLSFGQVIPLDLAVAVIDIWRHRHTGPLAVGTVSMTATDKRVRTNNKHLSQERLLTRASTYKHMQQEPPVQCS